MKKLIFIIPVLLLIVAGCDSLNFQDSINNDADAVQAPNTQGLLAAAINSFFTNSSRNYLHKPTLYVQWRSQFVYTEESLYPSTSGFWGQWYNTTLKNLKRVRQILDVPKKKLSDLTLSYGAPVNQSAVAELFACYVWKRVTDTFGPVPYFEALTDSISSPAYTPQEKIYKDLVKRIRDARDMLNPNKAGPTGDVMYGGNVMKWKKFANSLLMSMAIQMSNVYPDPGGYAASVFKEALHNSAGYIDQVSEEFWYDYANIAGSSNPYSNFRRPDYSLSEALVNAMKGNADGTVIKFSSNTFDPRLRVYSTDASLPGRPYGYSENGGDTQAYEAISLTMSKPGAPLHYMTAAYTFLNRAEAAALGWTNENAKKLLRQAIKTSFKSLDVHYNNYTKVNGVHDGTLTSKAAAFAKARLADAARVGILQVIREEKWVALFPRGFQAWSERRRTNTPWLLPAPDAVNGGIFPNRYQYPGTEPGVNSKNYKAAVQMLSPAEDLNTSMFWWEQGTKQ